MTLSASGVSAAVLSCLTSTACQQGKPAGFTHEKHGCIHEPVTKFCLNLKPNYIKADELCINRFGLVKNNGK